jgi:hypothetical protein
MKTITYVESISTEQPDALLPVGLDLNRRPTTTGVVAESDGPIERFAQLDNIGPSEIETPSTVVKDDLPLSCGRDRLSNDPLSPTEGPEFLPAAISSFFEIKSHEARSSGNTVAPSCPLITGNRPEIREAALRRRAIEILTASELTKDSGASKLPARPEATYVEQTTIIEEIEKEFLQQQRKQEEDIVKAKELTERLRNNTSLNTDPESFQDIQEVMQIISSANIYSLATLSNSNLTDLHEIITTSSSVADATQKPFNWGIKLVEEQDWQRLFLFQFFFVVFMLYIFEPWKSLSYCSLKIWLHHFFATSWIEYHGTLRFPAVLFIRTIIAALIHSLSNHHITTNDPYMAASPCSNIYKSFGCSLLINSLGFLAVDFPLLFFWKALFVFNFGFWWAFASGFDIKYRAYHVTTWHVWFLLVAIFLVADNLSQGDI